MAQYIFPAVSVDTTGLATEATLAALEAKDFATETTLATILDETFGIHTDLDNIYNNTQTLVAVDYATEATQATILDEILGMHTDLDNIYNDTQVLVAVDYATESTLASIQGSVDSINTQVSELLLEPVDQLDAELLDISSTNIPASSSLPLEVVSSLAQAVRKVQTVEDIGAFIGIYTGAASSEVLVAVLPLGGGEVEVNIPAAERISLRAMENTAISSGKIAINFLGP